jgi:hypothetical protein
MTMYGVVSFLGIHGVPEKELLDTVLTNACE